MPDAPVDKTYLPIADASDAADVDQRRPDRVDASPSLIPMLRDPADFAITDEGQRFVEFDDQHPEATKQQDPTDRLTAARGLVFASFLAVPVWLVIGATFYLLLR